MCRAGEVGEVLNEYFVLIFTKEKELVEDDLREGRVEFLSHIDIKCKEVLHILKSIRGNKSPGPDGIYPRILREEVMKMIDEGKAIYFICMDFSKDFDNVPLCRLVQKVKSHGIR
eukprot:g30471.t1